MSYSRRRREEPLYCDMCGRPITGRAYRVVIEGAFMTVCQRCYSRYAGRSSPETPMRLRGLPQVEAPAPAAPPAATTTTRRRSSAERRAPRRSTALAPRRGGGLGAVERYEVVDDYASRIRRARERLGWTQALLAAKVKVSEKVIKRIESGSLKPTIDLARRLERVLGIKLLEPVIEEEEEAGGREEFYLTLGDIAEIREE